MRDKDDEMKKEEDVDLKVRTICINLQATEIVIYAPENTESHESQRLQTLLTYFYSSLEAYMTESNGEVDRLKEVIEIQENMCKKRCDYLNEFRLFHYKERAIMRVIGDISQDPEIFGIKK